MAALASLITVEEYRRLPEEPGRLYELHAGRLVDVGYPTAGRVRLRLRLSRLLDATLTDFEIGEVIAFRAMPEFDLRACDIAAVSRRAGMRWIPKTTSTAPPSW